MSPLIHTVRGMRTHRRRANILLSLSIRPPLKYNHGRYVKRLIKHSFAGGKSRMTLGRALFGFRGRLSLRDYWIKGALVLVANRDSDCACLLVGAGRDYPGALCDHKPCLYLAEAGDRGETTSLLPWPLGVVCGNTSHSRCKHRFPDLDDRAGGVPARNGRP